MAEKFLNIDSKEIQNLANKLKTLHRSAMPVAVRETLNDVAFLDKKEFITKAFDDNFTIRKKNFIKSHIGVQKSPNTFNMNQMVAKAGVIKGKSLAGNQLVAQEEGGKVPNRELLNLTTSRVANSQNRTVKGKNRISKIKIPKKRITRKIDFYKEAALVGVGGIVKFRHLIIRVDRISSRGAIKSTALYSYRPSKKVVKINRNPFLAPSGQMAAKKMPAIFNKRANKKLLKVMS